MAMQKYAPLVFSSLSHLEQVANSVSAESSYVLASARMPQALLQLRAIGKFHLFLDGDVSSLDSLAQLEFVDVEKEDILEMYKQSAVDLGYGRISLVSKGQMTHDLSEGLDLICGLQPDVEVLAELVKDNEKVDKTGAVALLKQLWKLQGIVHGLSDLRSQNGFSAFENSVYGHLVMACYDFSASIQGRISDISEVFGDTPRGAFKIFQLAQAIDTSLVRAEVNSELGINTAVYFSPRVDLEVVESVL